MEHGQGLAASRVIPVMNRDRWQEIKRIFDAALDRAPSQRSEFVAEACRDDDELFAEVNSLLRSLDDARGFMEQPAVGEVAEQIAAGRTGKYSKGQSVGQYRIISELGTGGQGTVYKAVDTKLDRMVALKMLPPDAASVDEASRRRFRREARLASLLDHPNICTVHDLVQADGSAFIVMQFVAGRDIRKLVGSRPLEIRTALKIVIQVCDALAAAHSRGIIHRDVKAQNVIVSDSGQVRIVDFGLAKLAGNRGRQKDETELTAAGFPYGTPAYAPPEQSRGENVDHRADVFSTGVLLYEMLSGSLPFRGRSAADVRHAVLFDEPEPVSERRGSPVPETLEVVVGRALAKEPSHRYQEIAGMRDDLLGVLRELPESQEGGTRTFLEGFTPVSLRHLPRWGWKATAAAAAMVVAIAAAVIYNFESRRRASGAPGKDPILITDFVNATGDAVFDDTLKQGLAIQLAQSPLLVIFPETRVRETLRQMERSPDERVTVDTGREICQRNGLKALIAGSIAVLGRHYVITLEAINAASGETIGRQQAEAAGKEEVLKSLSSAASGIRERLGESLSSIRQSDIPLYQLTTPSLEALKSFAIGFDRSNRGEYFQSIPMFTRAVELDPRFAYGFSLLAGNYTIVEEPRRAAENASRAFALKERGSDREKLYITGVYNHYALGDLDKTIEVLHVYDQSYPNDFRASGNLSLAYLRLGQYAKAVSEARESVRLNPGISAWHVTLGTALMRLNRFGEAREGLNRALQMGLDDPRMHARLYELAFLEHDREGMQRQLTWRHGLPEEYVAADLQTATAAFLGHWRESQASARHAIDLAMRADLSEVAARIAAEAGVRAAALGRCDQASPWVGQSLALDQNEVTRELVALSRALCGEGGALPSIDSALRERPGDTLLKGLWAPVVHAAAELRNGNGDGALKALEATQAWEPAAGFWTHYLRGQADLKLGKASDAAVEFRQILSHSGEAPLSILYPLARLGLARASLQAGDRAAALAAYQGFLEGWRDADPDLADLRAGRGEVGKVRGVGDGGRPVGPLPNHQPDANSSVPLRPSPGEDSSLVTCCRTGSRFDACELRDLVASPTRDARRKMISRSEKPSLLRYDVVYMSSRKHFRAPSGITLRSTPLVRGPGSIDE
jgi:serine/threonine protein kinase/tetratricopeptide (TPR) repeat protein